MLGLSCDYKPQEHCVIKPELLRWCKARIPDKKIRERLFVYKHNKHHTFVIAEWLNQPYGRFIDLVNIGTSLQNFDRSMAERFCRNFFNPITAKDVIKQLRRSQSDYTTRQDNLNHENTNYMRKRGFEC